jgi:hypothetical protein
MTIAGQPDRADWIVRGLALGGLAGLATGAVAGTGARLVMRGFAVAVDRPTEFTPGGTMVILTFGLIVGPAAAVGYVALRRLLPGSWPVRGLSYGALLAVLVALAFSATPADEALPDPVLGTVLFAALAIVIGVVSAGATRWLDGRVLVPSAKPSGLVVVGAWIGVVGALMLGSIVLSVVSGLSS